MSLFLSILLLAPYLQSGLVPKTPDNTILVLKQSSRKNSQTPHQQYVELLEGFQAGIDDLPSRWHVEVVDIHDREKLASATPDRYRFVVCLGTYPAKLGRTKYANVPMIYSMVLNPGRHQLLTVSPNVDEGVQGGILARISPLDYLNNIQEVHPDAKKIGMLYANDVFQKYADEIMVEANQRGLDTVCEVVGNKRELIPKFNKLLKQDIDLFLMLPDTEIFSKSYEFIFMETMRRDVPVMGPSLSYVQAGALWGVVLSPYDIGLQTADMMEKALNGQRLSIEYPKQNKLTFNYVVARKLNITFPNTLVDKARSEGRVVE